MKGFVLQEMDFSNAKILSNDEIIELIKKNTEEAKEKIIYSNIKLVKYIINKYFGYYTKEYGWDDIFQEGLLGLLQAIDNYDSSKNTKFLTYASTYIEGYIRTFLRSKNKILNFGKYELALSNKIMRVNEIYQNRYYRELDDKELSILFNISENKVRELRKEIPVESIHKQNEDGSYYFELPDYTYDTKECELRIIIKDILNKYSNRNKNIILDNIYNDIKQDQLAKKYGISQAQISRIILSFKKELKKAYDYKVCCNIKVENKQKLKKTNIYDYINNYNPKVINYIINNYLSADEKKSIESINYKLQNNISLNDHEYTKMKNLCLKIVYNIAMIIIQTEDGIIEKEKVKKFVKNK